MPLSFLGAGKYQTKLLADADGEPTKLVERTEQVAASSELKFDVPRGGGFVATIRPELVASCGSTSIRRLRVSLPRVSRCPRGRIARSGHFRQTVTESPVARLAPGVLYCERMSRVELAIIRDVLDADGEPLDAVRESWRDEKLIVPPAAIARDDVVLGWGEFRLGKVVSRRPAVDACVAARGVPLARRSELKNRGLRGSTHAEEVSRYVVEHRRRKANRVDAAQHPAVSFDEVAAGDFAPIAFDRRHRQRSRGAGQCDH